MTEEFKKLPAKYKNYPIGKAFKLPDEKYGKIDCLIEHCKPPSFIKEFYLVHTCKYSFSGLSQCRVNRWGCSIHYRHSEINIFGIED